MTFRRKQRWLRRFALGFAFATALLAGNVSPAWGKYDEGGANGYMVSVGGWSGIVDADTGVPVSAGLDESLNADVNQVIPYLSHGTLTQAQADASMVPSGDELAIRNAIADRLARDGNAARSAKAIHDPDLTGLFVRQSEAATRPDDKAIRFTGLEQPRVVNYLSHGLAIDGDVRARPDNRADRFSPADGVSPTRVEVSGSTEWDSVLTFGIGALTLALALGLALGYLRRPRLAL